MLSSTTMASDSRRVPPTRRFESLTSLMASQRDSLTSSKGTPCTCLSIESFYTDISLPLLVLPCPCLLLRLLPAFRPHAATTPLSGSSPGLILPLEPSSPRPRTTARSLSGRRRVEPPSARPRTRALRLEEPKGATEALELEELERGRGGRSSRSIACTGLAVSSAW
jgi:hypothetical protein